jgi:ribosomal protein S18
MIHQAELQEADRRAKRVAELEGTHAVETYLGAVKLRDKSLEVLRGRINAGEKVKAGKLTLTQRVTLSVDWKECLSAVLVAAGRVLPAEATDLVAQAQRKDPAAPFVSGRLSIEVVPAEEPCPSPAPSP